jgi:hypothetical protein
MAPVRSSQAREQEYRRSLVCRLQHWRHPFRRRHARTEGATS